MKTRKKLQHNPIHDHEFKLRYRKFLKLYSLRQWHL